MARNKHPEETIQLILDKSLELFMEKGYEATSIQDIINHLGGLSKGAIYHHFKSKEDIFLAVCEKLGKMNENYYSTIRDDKTKNGKERLRAFLSGGYQNPNSKAMESLFTQIIKDPKFFQNQVREEVEVVSTKYIYPVIMQGIEDGSLQVEHPQEFSEVIILLLNVWINPILFQTTKEKMEQKLRFFQYLLKSMGADVMTEEMIAGYVNTFQIFT